jgi:hypothetical protein
LFQPSSSAWPCSCGRRQVSWRMAPHQPRPHPAPGLPACRPAPRRQHRRGPAAARVRFAPTAEVAAVPLSLQRLPPRSPLPKLDGSHHPAMRTLRRHCHLSGFPHAEHRGPYSASPARLIRSTARTSRHKGSSCSGSSPANHIRCSLGVGRTAAGQHPCCPARASTPQADSTTPGMVPAFLTPSPFSRIRHSFARHAAGPQLARAPRAR